MKAHRQAFNPEDLEIVPGPPITTYPLELGQLCRLRSGGPVMTVKAVEGDNVLCTWPGCDAGGAQLAWTFKRPMLEHITN